MASYKFSRNKSIGFFRCQSVDLQVAQPTTRETSVGHDWMVCCWCVVWSCRQRVGKTMHEAFGGPTYLHIPTFYLHTYIPTYPPPCMHAMHNIYTVQCLWLNNNRMRCGRFDNQGCIKNHIHKISANYIFSDAEGYFSKQNQFLFGGRTCELHLKIEYTPKCHLSNESYDTPVIYSGYWGCSPIFSKTNPSNTTGFLFQSLFTKICQALEATKRRVAVSLAKRNVSQKSMSVPSGPREGKLVKRFIDGPNFRVVQPTKLWKFTKKNSGIMMCFFYMGL